MSKRSENPPEFMYIAFNKECEGWNSYSSIEEMTSAMSERVLETYTVVRYKKDTIGKVDFKIAFIPVENKVEKNENPRFIPDGE